LHLEEYLPLQKVLTLVAGGSRGSLVMGSGPLGIILSTGKASKYVLTLVARRDGGSLVMGFGPLGTVLSTGKASKYVFTLVAGGRFGSLVTGSGPLGTFLNSRMASKLSNSNGERQADAIDGSISGRKSIANRATTMFLLCPVIAIGKTMLPGVLLQLSKSPLLWSMLRF
jgi:hypothetical protein